MECYVECFFGSFVCIMMHVSILARYMFCCALGWRCFVFVCYVVWSVEYCVLCFVHCVLCELFFCACILCVCSFWFVCCMWLSVLCICVFCFSVVCVLYFTCVLHSVLPSNDACDVLSVALRVVLCYALCFFLRCMLNVVHMRCLLVYVWCVLQTNSRHRHNQNYISTHIYLMSTSVYSIKYIKTYIQICTNIHTYIQNFIYINKHI